MREGYYLFDLDNKSFLSFIDNLTEDAIKSNSDYVIYWRAREYYDKRLVKNVDRLSISFISRLYKGISEILRESG